MAVIRTFMARDNGYEGDVETLALKAKITIEPTRKNNDNQPGAEGWTHLDLIAKFVFQLVAIVGFVLLARKVWQRERSGNEKGLATRKVWQRERDHSQPVD